MKKIEDYTDEQLLNLFNNSLEIISKNKPLKNKAEIKISEIKQVWNKRKMSI